MSDSRVYNKVQVESYVEFEIKWLDRMNDLEDGKYMDVKYLAYCSYIDQLSGRIFCNEKVNSRRFVKLLTEYYDGDEFRLVDLFYFDQASAFIHDNPKNEYLKIKARHYFDMLNKNLALYEVLKESVKEKILGISYSKENHGDRYQELNSLKQLFSGNDKLNHEDTFKYFELFTNVYVVYHFLRCPLVHELYSSLITKWYSLDGESRFVASSNITPELLDAVIRKILNKWKDQLIREKYYTYTFPGVPMSG